MGDKTKAMFRKLEESLWQSEARFDDALMERVFASDRIEFGCSGRIYQRADLLTGQSGRSEIDAVLPLEDMSVRALSGDIVQVTYVSEVRYGGHVERANRSSLWRRDAVGWRLCFHQGTPLSDRV